MYKLNMVANVSRQRNRKTNRGTSHVSDMFPSHIDAVDSYNRQSNDTCSVIDAFDKSRGGAMQTARTT